MKFDFDVPKATGLLAFFFVAFSFALALPIIIFNAWVVTKLWGWYIVPAFGLPPLAMIYAYGLSVFAGMFKAPYYGEDNRDVSVRIGSLVAAPFAALLMGWIGTFFM